MSTISVFKDKRIVLGVTGSIAAYKAVDLASKLTQAGAVVSVVMTGSAQRFVTPLTFQAVTGQPVYTDMWQADQSGGLPTHIAHVGLGEGADLMIIAPATAHTMARLAHGLADDLLSVTCLAIRCPLALAPAMDGGMYEHPATQANLEILKARGAAIIEPEHGRFASGLVGKGRLPETPTLLGYIRRILGQTGPLAGHKVVVTAGPTREDIDPVRFVTNHSSGKQGYALAQAALDAGADVTLISTIEGLPLPVGATLVKASSAQSLLERVLDSISDTSALIMAAAVGDFRPETVAEQKIKKSDDASVGMTLELTRTPDILLNVKKYREQNHSPQVVVGFAAESHDLVNNARSKLERKGLDLIAANDILADDAGFRADTNRITLIDRVGNVDVLDLMSKAEVSQLIIQRIVRLLNT